MYNEENELHVDQRFGYNLALADVEREIKRLLALPTDDANVSARNYFAGYRTALFDLLEVIKGQQNA